MVCDHLQVDLVEDMALHVADGFFEPDVFALNLFNFRSSSKVVQKPQHLMACTDAQFPGLAQSFIPDFLEEESPVGSNFYRVHGFQSFGKFKLLGTEEEGGIVRKALLLIRFNAMDGLSCGDEQ